MPIGIELIDGYVQVMPAGVPLQLQQSMSTLVEGYARSEFVDDAGLAVYTLESRISDVAAALEMLYANAVWRVGHVFPPAARHVEYFSSNLLAQDLA